MVPKKRDKIVIGINSLANTNYAAYTNHIQLFYQLGRRYPTTDFVLVNPMRMSIDRMKNLAAETALEVGAKYLLILDDDVVVPQPFNFLDKLISCDADVACGDVIIRGYPFNHMIFKYVKKGDVRSGLKAIESIPKKLGPLQVDAVGFSLVLIKCELLLNLEKPYFVTGVNNTEDIYFCVKARDKYPDCKIICDTSIQCGHILWAEVIDYNNRKEYKKYHEALYGKPSDKKIDRGNEYYAIVSQKQDQKKQGTGK